MEKTDTFTRFEEELKMFGDKLQNVTLQYKDGIKMYELCQNLFLRYEQIRDSRDIWKKKYFELKQSLKKDPRTITSIDPKYEKDARQSSSDNKSYIKKNDLKN